MYSQIKFAVAALALSTVAMAQSDGPFQVRYASHLDLAIGNANVDRPDAVVNFTNTGANNTADICVNTYTFAADEQLVSCCSCRVTRNALWSLAVYKDLLANTLTPLGDIAKNGVVIKLLATQAGAPGTNCNPANPGATVQGLAAWGTSAHFANGTIDGTVNGNAGASAIYGTETAFTNATLSTAEQTIMTQYCGFIQSNGSGHGICAACQKDVSGGFQPNGLGADDPKYNRGLGGDQQ